MQFQPSHVMYICYHWDIYIYMEQLQTNFLPMAQYLPCVFLMAILGYHSPLLPFQDSDWSAPAKRSLEGISEQAQPHDAQPVMSEE